MIRERNVISIADCKSYASEANLDKALAKLGLDQYIDRAPDGQRIQCRYIKCRTPDGRWTAVFLASEFINICGGYLGFAARHGFMSV